MIGVVLAGGSGTRFWPMSRQSRPKQLVKLWGDRPMIDETVARLAQHIPTEKIFVVCGRHQIDDTREAVADLPDENFIVEPCARNTAPAIGLAAARAAAKFGDEPIGVFPSDHFIGGLESFFDCLDLADAAARDGHIVTMGIEPTRPETGYGYIHFNANDVAESANGLDAHMVHEFVEKPDRERAEEYLEAGTYVWNSGMFVLTPSTLFGEMERQLPEMHRAMQDIKSGYEEGHSESDAVIEEAFRSAESVSIDYGVMEGAKDVVVIPATFKWSDVGHWAAIDEVREPDEDGNVVSADAILEEVKNTVVYSEESDRLVAAVGLEDMVIVDTPDALLVLPKDDAQKVRDIVQRLRDEKRDDVL